MDVWPRSSLVPRGGRQAHGARIRVTLTLAAQELGASWEAGVAGSDVGERAGARPRGSPPTLLKLG